VLFVGVLCLCAQECNCSTLLCSGSSLSLSLSVFLCLSLIELSRVTISAVQSPPSLQHAQIDGVWHTHIDFDKFQELNTSGEHFTAADYMLPTPHWALLGSEERGFDPEHTRFRRKRGGGNIRRDD
jgi:hypothetical protein